MIDLLACDGKVVACFSCLIVGLEELRQPLWGCTMTAGSGEPTQTSIAEEKIWLQARRVSQLN